MIAGGAGGDNESYHVPLAKTNDRPKWRGQLPTDSPTAPDEEANAQQYQFNNLKGSYILQFTKIKDIWSVARDKS